MRSKLNLVLFTKMICFATNKQIKKIMNNLNTQNPNHYHFDTKYLDIQILGGIRFNNLEALRVTLGLQKKDSHPQLA
jgi:hypothetical protein